MRNKGNITLDFLWHEWYQTQAFLKFLKYLGYSPNRDFFIKYKTKSIDRRKAMFYLGINGPAKHKDFILLMRKEKWLIGKVWREGDGETAAELENN